MKRIEAISIYGGEVPDGDVMDEFDNNEISTHYATSAFTAYPDSWPATWAWLVENQMITGEETSVVCVCWGT